MAQRTFPHVDALCTLKEAFLRTPERDALLLEAMRENYRLQHEIHPFLRALAERAGFGPEDLREPEDVCRIPPLFVGVLKLHRFCSVAEHEVALTLSSSGTTGQKSQIILDGPSLARLQAICGPIYGDLGYRSEVPAHYLLFSYDRARAGDVGTSWSTEQEMGHAPARSAHWLIRWDEARGQFGFDAEEAARLLIRLAPEGPLRLVGFPAFMHMALQAIRRLAPGLRVDPRSFVLAGGGWKSHAGAPMTHAEFARSVEESIGLPRQNVRDGYGMVEHGVPYQACAEARHHVPVYSRLRILDPVTLEPRGYGEEGLLHLLTPYNTAQPNCSVLSTDVAVLGRDCPCGIPGEYIASVRRGGTHKHKGCAIAAQEILDRMPRRG
jgi:hypothetical protein